MAGELSEHFHRREFACKCGCGFDTVDAELIRCLEELRQALGQGIFINSGCRCEKYNEEIGGRPRSMHLVGKAADISVVDTRTDEVFNKLLCLWPNFYGKGFYHSFVHFDVRPVATTW